MRPTSIAIFFVVLMSATPALAQTRSPAEAGVADTTVVRLLSVGLIRGLDGSIAKLLFDPPAVPWTISVPDSTSPPWRELRANLFSLLRARGSTPEDSTENYLRIGTIEMVGDTLVARFTVGVRWRCRDGSWTGGLTRFKHTAVRHATSWEYPQTEAGGWGDGMCLSPPIPDLREGDSHSKGQDPRTD